MSYYKLQATLIYFMRKNDTSVQIIGRFVDTTYVKQLTNVHT